MSEGRASLCAARYWYAYCALCDWTGEPRDTPEAAGADRTKHEGQPGEHRTEIREDAFREVE